MSREKLTQIIEADEGRNWWMPESFERLIRSQLPSELEIVSAPPFEQENYNCFVYVLGLNNDPDFLGGNNPIQKEFIRYLLKHGLLQPTDIPTSGSLVFYEDKDFVITHGGIVIDRENIISKWMWGPTIRHNLWDVPSSFGNKIFHCNPVSSQVAKEAYLEYKNSGVEIRPIT